MRTADISSSTIGTARDLLPLPLTIRTIANPPSRKVRDELLDGEVFDTLLGAQVSVERWRSHYNTYACAASAVVRCLT